MQPQQLKNQYLLMQPQQLKNQYLHMQPQQFKNQYLHMQPQQFKNQYLHMQPKSLKISTSTCNQRSSKLVPHEPQQFKNQYLIWINTFFGHVIINAACKFPITILTATIYSNCVNLWCSLDITFINHTINLQSSINLKQFMSMVYYNRGVAEYGNTNLIQLRFNI